jgi:DNA-binding transcriptional MerR regulator
VHISELARAGGVGVSTLRYYERRGLVTAATRTRGGYRTYDHEALRRLRFIRRAQRLGFTLAEVEQVLALPDSIPSGLDELSGVIAEKVDQIEQRIRDLERMRLALLDLAHNGARQPCPVLAALADD